MDKKFSWSRVRKVVGVFFLVFFVIGILGAITNGLAPSNKSSSSNEMGNDLHAKVIPASDGFVITNTNSSDWNDCMVGVNGGTGWGADNPPYKTRTPLVFKAGAVKTVYFRNMSMDDGTIFDPSTHAVNSIVISCNQGTRLWVGTPN